MTAPGHLMSSPIPTTVTGESGTSAGPLSPPRTREEGIPYPRVPSTADLSDEAVRVLASLPKSRSGATSIPALVRDTGLSDRAVRAALEELVVAYELSVVTLPIARGVWITNEPEEARAAARQLESRAIALHRRARALRRAADRLEYRETLFDLEEAS